MLQPQLSDATNVCDYKPTVSKLFTKINLLNGPEKRILLERANQLFKIFLSSEKVDSKEMTNRVFDIYAKSNDVNIVNEIMLKLELDLFQVVAAICLHLRENMENPTDLTKLIRFLAVDEYMVIRMVDTLILRVPTADDIMKELLIIPADALLLLTLIWSELQLPKVARLFESYLSHPDIGPVSEEECKIVEELFEHLLDMQLCLHMDNRGDAEKQAQFEKELDEMKEMFDTQLKESEHMVQDLKNLKQIVNHQQEQSYYVETILSDSSSETDSENFEEELYVSTQRITTRWPKWLEQELCQANLKEHTKLEHEHFYFAPFSKVFSGDPHAISAMGYTKCRLQKTGDQYLVQGIHPEGTSSPFAFIEPNELAMGDPPSIRCPEGTRVIALCERVTERIGPWELKFFTGTVGTNPFSQNRFEYLIFFDNGVDAYAKPADIRLLLDQPLTEFRKFEPRNAYKKLLGEDMKVRSEFLRQYLRAYPDWPLIKLKKSENTQRILARWGGQNQSAFVLDLDRQLALLRFPAKSSVAWPTGGGVMAKDCVVIGCKDHEHIDEWVYRGNPICFLTLPQAHGFNQLKAKTLQDNSRQMVRHSRKVHASQFEMAIPPNSAQVYKLLQEVKQKQTARKSSKQAMIDFDPSIQIPINRHEPEVDPHILRQKQKAMHVKEEMLPVPIWVHPNPNQAHGPSATGYGLRNKKLYLYCTFKCLDMATPKSSSATSEQNHQMHPSPYLIPLLNGWTRMCLDLHGTRKSKNKKKTCPQQKILYRTPCGYVLNNIEKVADYLLATRLPDEVLLHTRKPVITIDMFTFDPEVRPQIRIKLTNVIEGGEDFTMGQETIPIPAVNVFDQKCKLPEMIYRPQRTEIKRKNNVTQNIDPEFCIGCSCTDDCAKNANCECRKLTVEAQNRLSESLQLDKKSPIGYYYRQLLDKQISGIYECNPTCKCNKDTCFNRVVQLSIKIPLQLFMTADKGWGVRSLIDIPKGTFVCTYSGELMDEARADEHGATHGDKYLADLDLIDTVEGEKQRQGIDLIGDEGYAGDDDEPANDADSDIIVTSDEDEAFIDQGPSTSRNSGNHLANAATRNVPSEMDELLNMNMKSAKQQQQPIPPKQQQRRKSAKWTMERYFDPSFVFVIDAAVTGNIGRFLNHSCEPNCQVQHCLVDTHDLRLPWCAFFTTTFVKAGNELTWDYAYTPEPGSQKKIDCKCGAEKCRGRLL